MKRIARSMIVAGGPLVRRSIWAAPSIAVRAGEFMSERVGDSRRAPQLVPLGEDDPPADEGQHDQNSEYEFCRASGAGDQLHRRARYGLPELQE